MSDNVFSDLGISKLVQVTPEQTLDPNVFNVMVIFSAGFAADLSKTTFRMIVNKKEGLLLQPARGSRGDGKDAKLTFGTTSGEVEVLEAKKKGMGMPLKAESSTMTSLIAGSRTGEYFGLQWFFKLTGNEHPTRANFFRGLMKLSRNEGVSPFTLNHAIDKADEVLLPLTRAEGIRKFIAGLKVPTSSVVLVCAPEEPIRRALQEMAAAEPGSDLWRMVEILDGENLTATHLQERIHDSITAHHRTSGHNVTPMSSIREPATGPWAASVIAYSPPPTVVDKLRYLEPNLPDLRGLLLVLAIDTNVLMQAVKDRRPGAEAGVTPGQRCAHFTEHLISPLIAELESLAMDSGARITVFLGPVQRLESLQGWERDIARAQGLDLLSDASHATLQAMEDVEQDGPPRAPGHPRRATRLLRTRLLEFTLIDLEEHAGPIATRSLCGFHRPEVASSTRSGIHAILPTVEQRIESAADKPRARLEKLRDALVRMDAALEEGEIIREKEGYEVKKLLDANAGSIDESASAELKASIQQLRDRSIIREVDPSKDTLIAWQFSALLRRKQLEYQGRRRVVGVFMSADQSAAHLASLADPTMIGAAPLEQTVYTFQGNRNGELVYPGGKVRCKALPLGDLPPSGDTVLLPAEQVHEEMRRTFRGLFAASIAQIISA